MYTQRQIETGNRRLLKLADFLKKVPKQRFYYGSWVGESWQGRQDLSCGTTACALGWAATMPDFRRLGLELVRERRNDYLGTVLNKKTHQTGEDAATDVFYLTSSEAFQLFIPLGYEARQATAKDVAKKIRDFVKNRRAAAKAAARAQK